MNDIYKINDAWLKNAKVNKEQYEKMYDESLSKNESFWSNHGKRIDWFKPYTKIKDVVYSKNQVSIKWYFDGTTNVSYNCIDRHAKKSPNKTAIIWEGDDPSKVKKISYKELQTNVCKMANVLKKIGVKKGDRVTIYLTMIPELAFVMLACSRIGAIHSIIFGGFSSDSIAGRIKDCNSEYIITADEGIRGGKTIPLKEITDKALDSCPDVKKCLVVKYTGNKVNMLNERDLYIDELISDVDEYCEPEEMNAEDPLVYFIYIWIDRKTKGCSSYNWWVFSLCLNDS